MGDRTKIAWTDATWNPFRGCSRISPGCQNCYAERMCSRGLPGLKSPIDGEDFATKTPSGPRWTGRVELIESALEIPLRWRKPRRIFVNSMSDTFHESISLLELERVWRVIVTAAGRGHTMIVPTKRVARMSQAIPVLMHRIFGPHWIPPERVILLASVEDQLRADERIPELFATPAAVRGISLEPMLGPVNLKRWLPPIGGGPQVNLLQPWADVPPTLDWVIVGGESGPEARPCRVEWIRDVVRQCREAGVSCFVKQLGARPERYMGINAALELQRFAGTDPDQTYHIKLGHPAGANPAEWPDDLRVQEWPEVRR